MNTPPVAIFGYGRFGRALARACADAGAAVALLGGRGDRPQELDAGAPWARGAAGFVAQSPPGALIVLAVSDGALPALAAEFATQPVAGRMFVHAAGAFGPDVLAPLAEAGAAVGVFHILQSFPPKDGHRRVRGSHAALSGPPKLMLVLYDLCRRLGLTPFELRDEQRVAYHAAAVLASNALVGLLDAGRGILEGAGIEAEHARAMLTPLAGGTLENITAAAGLEAALTGPVVRGDADTVARHLATLEGESRALYVEVCRAVLRLARRSGRAPEDGLRAIETLLDAS